MRERVKCRATDLTAFWKIFFFVLFLITVIGIIGYSGVLGLSRSLNSR